jgi:hypothetical protein
MSTTPTCPLCGESLHEVTQPPFSPLNRDQWAATIPGTWFCKCSNNNRGNRPYAYFWDSEVRSHPCPLCGLMHDEECCRLPGLQLLFAGPLTDREERFLRWLASCDVDSIEAFKALVQRAADEWTGTVAS